jgi:antibiotic biosynthesis monooxygenase (ABM) superfamily enzyme
MKIPNPTAANWPSPGSEREPVTITVTRIAKPGAEAAFEEWMAGVCSVASRFEGHRGFTVLRPPDPRSREYILIFRFDSMEHLRRWNESPVRDEWLERARPLTVGDPRVELTTGLEHWFTLPKAAGVAPPPRHKMALLTWLAIFPLILLFSTVFLPYLTVLPWPLPTALMSVMLVLLMTYVVMPRITRLFSGWLFGR